MTEWRQNLRSVASATLLNYRSPLKYGAPTVMRDYVLNGEKRHGVSRASENHKIIPTETYQTLPSYILNIKHTCNIHDEKCQTYCKKHDCLCCHKCVIETRNKCQELKAIDEVTKEVKKSNALQGLEDSVSEITENVAKIIKKKRIQSSNFKRTKEKYRRRNYCC